jgi:SAM-dependent methyltransferase
MDLDDPETTRIRRAVIEDKPFLKSIYEEWYGAVAAHLPDGPGGVLELGSGAGFLDEFVPAVMKSDLLPCPGLQLVLDAQVLPYRDASLRAITMINVLHHIPKSPTFFREAVRCLQPGGRIIAIEPWVSWWSKVVYRKLHHEPIDPENKDWSFSGTNPLSDANGALPWIIFERDRKRFEAEFPEFSIKHVEGIMPFRYLVCGGISMRGLMPAFTFPAWRGLENSLRPFMRNWAMFALIVVERR